MSAIIAKTAVQAVATSAASARPAPRRIGAARLPTGPLRQAHVCRVVGRNETADQAKARRVRESEQLSDRVTVVTTMAELDAEVDKAGDKLMVIEVLSEQHCQVDAEHEIDLGPCAGLKHSFQRTARDCPDAIFLEVEVDEDSDLLDTLGVDVLPTIQFVKGGKLLWQHEGVTNLDQDLAEGVLFYGDAAAGGMHPSEFITEIKNKADLEAWSKSLGDKTLGVLDVSVSGSAACVHIYPTVVVLARQFKGFANFGRLLADTSAETKALAEELNVRSAPTFRFYRNGQVVGEHVGTSRSDLISAILSKQAELGLTPPPPEEGRRERRKHAAEDKKAAAVKGKKKRWNTIF